MKINELSNYDKYKFELAGSESNFKKLGNKSYTEKNKFSGALGKYQFMPTTIRLIANMINIPVPTESEFLNSPELQERFMDVYNQDSLNYIANNNLDRFKGVYVIGKTNSIASEINVYGLLAGAHLGGANNLKNFITKNKDVSDGRTFISDYVAKFSYLVPEKKNC